MTTFKSARFFFFFARHQVHDFLVAATQRGLRLVFGLAGGPLGLPFSLSVALAIADDLAIAVDDAAAALAAAAAAAVASVDCVYGWGWQCGRKLQWPDSDCGVRFR